MNDHPSSDATGLGPRAQLEERRLALEFERLRLERQKASVELHLRRRELKAAKQKAWKEFFVNPLMLAIVGGFVTLMTTTIANSVNSWNTISAETAKARQSLQADLIKKFVESPKPETVRTNLSFLVDVGLLPDYADRIRTYLTDNPNSAPTASPSGLQAIDNDDDAIDLAMSLEGGYMDGPGGVTNFGITESQLSGYLGKEASKEELRNLSKDTARDIYRKFYFDSFSPIASVKVKATYLGMAVNIGKAHAISILQAAAAKITGERIPPDGILGLWSVKVINSIRADELIENVDCEWMRFYRSRPSFSKFENSFLKRVRTYLPAKPLGICPDVLPLANVVATP